MKILIIDNNKETTAMLSKLFNAKGFSPSISNDPMQGLCLIRQEKFDVILLDVNTPVVSGIGIIELLASDDLLKDQNIFIFSEEELNYLYSLFKRPLRSTLNPFLLVRIVKKALEPVMSQVQKEMPSLVEKLKILEIDNFDKIIPNLKKVIDV